MTDTDLIMAALNKHGERLARIETNTENVKVDLAEHHATLYGNGKDGLKTRVDRVEQDHNRWKKGFAFFQTLVSGVLIWLGKEALT